MSFFLGSNKRDLSKKSRDGENSSLSSLPDDVFSDGSNSPELAKLLVNCLKSIENQVKELFNFHEEAKEPQNIVIELLQFMSAKFDDIKKSSKKMKRLIS